MAFDLTKLVRPYFIRRVKFCERFADYGDSVQLDELKYLVSAGSRTEYGRRYGITRATTYSEFAERLPVMTYENLRDDIMRVCVGEPDILWPGKVKHFAQSSGTSDGRSKYIPITRESFSRCHYKGASDVVAHYLNMNPESRIFSGKAFILGGSFAKAPFSRKGICVGDLSANLIANINPAVNLARVPSKSIALMHDWTEKLPALVKASMNSDITNISGVPSWFLAVLKEVMKAKGANSIHDVWPNLEVFFHGGISFAPYRSQYQDFCDPKKMHYVETYNASEGFFAVQSSWDTKAMMLILDAGVFFEFQPLFPEGAAPIPIWEVEQGKTYSLIITSNNGLWRYAIGDTVKIESLSPVKITIAGRTKHFINAFGEELMVHNADAAISKTSLASGVKILNYTVAPLYATSINKGRHQWLIEFDGYYSDKEIKDFEMLLDDNLRRENSDYDAKRSGNLFIDPLEIIVARHKLFDDWLLATSGKLGGQRKIPRLSNNRDIIESMLDFQDRK